MTSETSLPTYRRHLATLAFDAVLALATLLTVVTSVAPLAGLPLHVSHDFGEGWNAYWAAAAVGGRPLYDAAHVFIANNYPPLSFYIVGSLGRVIGDDIIAGRIIAVVSMVGVAALIVRIVLMCGATRRWAAAAALIFLLYNLVYLRALVAVDNPQWLGQLIMLASLPPLLATPPSQLRGRTLARVALLMIVAGLVKHNMFALPVAVALWLAIYNRRAFAVWLGAAALLASSACAILYLLYGPAVYAEIIGFKRVVSLPTFKLGLGKTGGMAPLIVVAALATLRDRHDPRSVLVGMVAGAGVVFGLLQRLGEGVTVNAHFDALIGLTIACSIFAGRRQRFKPARSLALLLTVLAPIILVAPKHVGSSIIDAKAIGREEGEWRTMIGTVRDAGSPAYCEILALCYWAGRPIELDFFAYGQKLRTGTSPLVLARRITGQDAHTIVVVRDREYLAGTGRLPVPFPQLIEANYHPVILDSNEMAVMVPNRISSLRPR